jgi:leucyl-tRNA synthetase
MFDGVSLDLNAVSKKVDKANRKRAMTFIQSLKKTLEAEGGKTSLERKLSFDEVYVLNETIPALKSTIERLKEVVIVVVDADGKGRSANGALVVDLPSMAASAEPGFPAFEFSNI